MRNHHWLRLGLLTVLFCAALAGDEKITLEQAETRTVPDYESAWEGRHVSLEGQVSTELLHSRESFALPIQDAAHFGMLVQGSGEQLAAFIPGDWIESSGIIRTHSGLPVLESSSIRLLAHGSRPAPLPLNLASVNSARYLSVLVTAEGHLTQFTPSMAYETIGLSDRGARASAFLVRRARDGNPELSAFRPGDRVRVTGLGTQYCPMPPYDHGFALRLNDPASLVLVERASMIDPVRLLCIAIFVGALLGAWWLRERRTGARRRRVRVLNDAAELVIASQSRADLVRKLSALGPNIWKDALLKLFVFNRSTRKLELIDLQSGNPTDAVVVDAPTGPLASTLVACFHDRKLVSIPDTRRSSYFKGLDRTDLPRSIIFIPMRAQDELAGVLQVDYGTAPHVFRQEEEEAFQHLANQIATALKLQEQQSIREQIFRSEKLAAAGQLISGVADELRFPLDAILTAAAELQRRYEEDGSVQSIVAETQRACDMVSRLVSFTRSDPSESQRVDVNVLLSDLIKFRQPEWRSRGITVRPQLSTTPLSVLGSEAQLEQVFLNLLVYGEQCVEGSSNKTIGITTTLFARRILVELAFEAPPTNFAYADPFAGEPGTPDALGFTVCRGIVQNHGGEIRLNSAAKPLARFEIELPLHEESGDGVTVRLSERRSRKELTVLVIDSDTRAQRQLLEMLSRHGDRVVPVSNVEEGAELIERMRFDATLCSARVPGLNWVEFLEKARASGTAFVLLTEGYDPNLATALQSSDGFILSKPIEEADLSRILEAVESLGPQHAERARARRQSHLQTTF